jgi:hypothetical protein
MVTMLPCPGAFALAVPQEQAMDIKDEVAFSQAIKDRRSNLNLPKTGGMGLI